MTGPQETPLVSIITVCLNAADTIRDCILSINGQTYHNIEHIIIDGGSSDGTQSIVDQYRSVRSSFSSGRDSGIYDAMNKGLAQARGTIVGFLNSDDLYATSDVIKKVVDLFSKISDLDACYSDLVYTKSRNTSTIVRFWKAGTYKVGSFSDGWSPPHPTFFLRRSTIKGIGGFNVRYRIASDVEFMIRYLEINRVRVHYEPEVWVKMRLGGTTNKSLKNIIIQNIEVIRALRNHGLPANNIRFFVKKFIQRMRQFLTRPPKRGGDLL